MTITYPNGAVREAVLLAREDDTLRAAVRGEVDVHIFTRTNGVWISEAGEPVTMQFEWQRPGTAHTPGESDCVCPKQVASRLISLLPACFERDETVANVLHVFSADGQRMRVRQSQLHVQ